MKTNRKSSSGGPPDPAQRTWARTATIVLSATLMVALAAAPAAAQPIGPVGPALDSLNEGSHTDLRPSSDEVWGGFRGPALLDFLAGSTSWPGACPVAVPGSPAATQSLSLPTPGPVIEGTAAWQLGAIVQVPCLGDVPTPLLPAGIDKGAVSRPFEIRFDIGQDCEYLPALEGYYFFLVVEVWIVDSAYDGQLPPWGLFASHVDFHLPDLYKQFPKNGLEKDVLGTGGETQCQAKKLAALGTALLEAKEWASERLAENQMVPCTASLKYVPMADGSYLIDLSGTATCTFTYDSEIAADSFEWEGFFTIFHRGAVTGVAHGVSQSFLVNPGAADDGGEKAADRGLRAGPLCGEDCWFHHPLLQNLGSICGEDSLCS